MHKLLFLTLILAGCSSSPPLAPRGVEHSLHPRDPTSPQHILAGTYIDSRRGDWLKVEGAAPFLALIHTTEGWGPPDSLLFNCSIRDTTYLVGENPNGSFLAVLSKSHQTFYGVMDYRTPGDPGHFGRVYTYLTRQRP